MKSCILFIIGIGLTNNLYAADWTAAFSYLEQGKKGDDGKLLDSIMKNTFEQITNTKNQNPDTQPIYKLSKMARTGKFNNISIAYRNDMLPAKVYYNKDDTYLMAVYPLKNATLYGLPLQSFSYYLGCDECDYVGFYATFKPMSKQQYLNLQKTIKFKNEEEDGCLGENQPLASFEQRNGRVHLSLNIGC
ncbi:hypothetical protein SAMN02745664_11834 [Moraxella cuniculi DSM 21768]|uniref:Uncharacterized protein n=1 Tax=Moraxella cuniculi DSM 21768 TaxID=1122245 RepID=A0A1N7FWU3_9GAMM|nr:hypothetical protein [Moraxella cuniculi]OOS03655.1 hypothetical protein B0189_09050 [Moraxella cuniculi]SIS04801.1 hypothetical protein SAMN02745664_11834 [Moraxella cuniculi DSM 21768]